MSVVYAYANERQRSKSFLEAILAAFFQYRLGIRELEKILAKKPDWASYTPNRSWRRHSALLTQLHEMHQER